MTLGSINCKFCASILLLVFKNFLILFIACLQFWSFIPCQVHKISFFSLLSCHQPFLFGGHVLGKRPHDLSGSTWCLRYLLPLLASHRLLPSSSSLQHISPQLMRLCLSPCTPALSWIVGCPLFKSFLFLSSLNNDGAKLYPKLTLQNTSSVLYRKHQTKLPF